MQSLSAYDVFTPRHTAWLHRQVEEGLDITEADLDSIEAAFPKAMEDPMFADHRAKAKAGMLRRRRGRKKQTIPEYLRLWAARFEMDDEIQLIWDERRSGKRPRVRGDLDPCFQAAETVARRYRLPCTGASLLKRLYKNGIR